MYRDTCMHILIQSLLCVNCVHAEAVNNFISIHRVNTIHLKVMDVHAAGDGSW